MQKGVPATIGGKTYFLHFNMWALLILDQKFGIKMDEASVAERNKQNKEYTAADEVMLTIQLAYAMTQASECPPTLQDMQQVTLLEYPALQVAVGAAMAEGKRGPLGEAPATEEYIADPVERRHGIGEQH